MLLLAAVALVACIVRAGLADVSQAWDSGYYHLPFAARLVGLLPDDVYRFSSGNAARFAGFPLLGELLQGLGWRLYGGPEGANLPCALTVPLFAWGASRLAPTQGGYARACLAGALTLLLFGIPLVMTHATSAYVDLPASACLALAMLRLVLMPSAAHRHGGETVITLGLLATSANMRLQHAPMVALVWSAWLSGWWSHRPPRRWLVLALPVLFFAPLKNLILWGNPAYPVELAPFGVSLPHADTRYSSSPDWLVAAPAPLRWGASVIELGLPSPIHASAYGIDQWTPPAHPAYRMAGLFAPGVLVVLACLAWLWQTKRLRPAETLAIVACTAVTACLPQAHELRYTLFWPIFLYAFVLLKLWRAARGVACLLALALPAVVIAVTGGTWIKPGGSSFEVLLRDKVEVTRIDATPDGASVCIDAAPRTWLYAAPFQRPRRTASYQVIEAEDDGTCRKALPRK
jgi:hypothetical protein